jgi:hypothetical protein
MDQPSRSENNAAVVDASDLNKAVKEMFGKAPYPRTVYLRAYAYIMDGTSASQVPASFLNTITVTPVAPPMKLQLYVPGGHQGWNPAAAPVLYNRDFDMKYDGYVYMDAGNEFKITPEANWDSDYGSGEENDILVEKGGNLSVSEAGFYRLLVDLSGSPLTYSATKTEWRLSGGAAGGWDNFIPMTLDIATGKWTVTTTLTVGAYKFRANDNWDINLGGDLGDLTYGGDDIPVSEAEAGEYTITLDLSNPVAYKATVSLH